MSVSAGVLAAFDATAHDYNTERRKLIPHFDLLYDAALDLIRDWGGPTHPRIIDLGAGTGLLAAMILEARPGASLLLLDGSDRMLSEARTRFAAQPSVRFQVADMAEAELESGNDLVVSSLAIHHLDDAGKRQLFWTDQKGAESRRNVHQRRTSLWPRSHLRCSLCAVVAPRHCREWCNHCTSGGRGRTHELRQMCFS